MFGDYEAQRHWQEVTVNLPVHHWYTNSSDNDLLYWGLDYPPLTAYHSYAVGKAGQLVNASFTELHGSRGLESEQHKLFMRLSVIVADLLVLFPAVRYLSGPSLSVSAILLCVYSGLILIDHGHFQYNNVSLGLFILAAALVTRNKDVFGSIIFSLALNYKQMELYHALPFFFFLLGKALKQRTVCQKLTKLIMIGSAVLLTFGLVWSPFLLQGLQPTLQVLNRIFPVNRGIFEDKVANFWCSVDIVLKLKQKLDITQLGLLCLASTFVLSLPSNLHLLMSPTARNFHLSQLNTSLVFFMFSFHVHEKSILLAAIPGILVTTSLSSTSLYTTLFLPWFLTISTFSMLPLLYKDGLLIPSLALLVLCLVLHANLDSLLPKPVQKARISSPLPVEPVSSWEKFLHFLHFVSLLGCAVLTALFLFYPPPDR